MQQHSNSKERASGRSKEKMADFMFLIDLAIFAAVIACAASLLREEKAGHSSTAASARHGVGLASDPIGNSHR
jgi:hypothetical protein